MAVYVTVCWCMAVHVNVCWCMAVHASMVEVDGTPIVIIDVLNSSTRLAELYCFNQTHELWKICLVCDDFRHISRISCHSEAVFCWYFRKDLLRFDIVVTYGESNCA